MRGGVLTFLYICIIPCEQSEKELAMAFCLFQQINEQKFRVQKYHVKCVRYRHTFLYIYYRIYTLQPVSRRTVATAVAALL